MRPDWRKKCLFYLENGLIRWQKPIFLEALCNRCNDLRLGISPAHVLDNPDEAVDEVRQSNANRSCLLLGEIISKAVTKKKSCCRRRRYYKNCVSFTIPWRASVAVYSADSSQLTAARCAGLPVQKVRIAVLANQQDKEFNWPRQCVNYHPNSKLPCWVNKRLR